VAWGESNGFRASRDGHVLKRTFSEETVTHRLKQAGGIFLRVRRDRFMSLGKQKNRLLAEELGTAQRN
jgi:hypothetical protein